MCAKLIALHAMLFFVVADARPLDVVSTETNTTDCILYVIRELFSADAFLNFVGLHQDDLEYVGKLENPRVVINRLSSTEIHGKPYSNNFVIHDDHRRTLLETLNKLQEARYWDKSSSPNGKYLLIVNSELDLNETFRIAWDFDITDVIALVDDARPHLCTYRPFSSKSNCGKTIVTECSRNCDPRELKENAKVVTNYQKCEAKMVVDHPIITKNLTPLFKVFWITMGFIGRYLNTVPTEYITTSVKPALFNRSEGLTFITLGKTILEHLDYYDMSMPFYRSHIVWIVPKPLKVSDVFVIVYVFDGVIWSTILSCLIIEVIVWLTFAKLGRQRRRRRRRRDDASFSEIFLSVYQLTLNSSPTVSPKTNVIRYILLFYALYCLNIYSIFQANLVNNLTETRYQKGITTVDDLINSQLDIISYKQVTKDYFPKIDTDRYLKLAKKFLIIEQLNRTDDFFKISKYRNCSTYITKDALIPGYLVDVVQDNTFLNEISLIIYTRRGNYFLNSINLLFNRLYETGIHGKIMSDATKRYYSAEDNDKKIKLNVCHLLGAFLVCGIGLFLAFLAFVCEIFAFRYYNSGSLTQIFQRIICRSRNE